MDTSWDQWLRSSWQELVAGTRLEVPAHLPHPGWCGMERTTGGWALAFADGRTLVVSEAGGDGARLIAELQSSNPLEEALKKIAVWASRHPRATIAIGVGVVVALLAAMLGKTRSGSASLPELGRVATLPASDDDSAVAPEMLHKGEARGVTRSTGDEARNAIAASFAKLVGSIQPAESDIARAESHANSIEAALKEAFTLNKLMIVGSHSRRTAVRGVSDVDYFAVVARDDARWGGKYASSDAVLKNVRTALQERFRRTEIGKDRQAVVVRFENGEDPVDVVPAVFLGMSTNGRPLYRMPDGRGGWLDTSPEGHNKYILEANARSGKKLRATAQLLKYWRTCRSLRVPIGSFHIELRLSAEDVCRVGMSYAECFVSGLQVLQRAQCQPITDPLGISGEVPACSTEAKRQAAGEAISSAVAFATTALTAEKRGDSEAAWRAWDRLFNRTFPE